MPQRNPVPQDTSQFIAKLDERVRALEKHHHTGTPQEPGRCVDVDEGGQIFLNLSPQAGNTLRCTPLGLFVPTLLSFNITGDFQELLDEADNVPYTFSAPGNDVSAWACNFDQFPDFPVPQTDFTSWVLPEGIWLFLLDMQVSHESLTGGVTNMTAGQSSSRMVFDFSLGYEFWDNRMMLSSICGQCTPDLQALVSNNLGVPATYLISVSGVRVSHHCGNCEGC